MARVQHRKARKDYPAVGIVAGDMYYFCQIKTGPRSSRTIRSKAPIPRSQLTSSEYLSALYAWEDDKAGIVDMDAAQEFAETIRSLGEEQREKLDNMPEGLQQGDTGQMLEERAAACEAAADEIEEAISEWDTARDAWETAFETYKSDLADYDEQERKIEAEEDRSEDEELVEPDLPDNTIGDDLDNYCFDESDFLEQVRDVSVE